MKFLDFIHKKKKEADQVKEQKPKFVTTPLQQEFLDKTVKHKWEYNEHGQIDVWGGVN